MDGLALGRPRPDGKIAGHSDPSKIGGNVQDLFGGETFEATAEGVWVESESLRVYVAETDGFVFGSGWSRDGHGHEHGP